MLTRVLVVSRAGGTVAMLMDYLGAAAGLELHGHVTTNGHADLLAGQDFKPDIVLLHVIEKQMAELLDWGGKPAEGRPVLIVIGPKDDAELTRLAFRSGARDYLTEPIDRGNLVSTLQEIRTELRSRAIQGRGTIHAFVSAAGGAGSSFIAANVAHVLASHAQRRTALVDLDLNFSPTAHHLALTSQRGLLEALEEVASIDEDALEGFGSRHASGLRLYCSTTKHAVLSKDVQSERLSAFVGLLAANFQEVIIDVPHAIDNLTATAFGLAASIHIVVQQSTLHVRNAARIIAILRDELGVPPARLKLVVNRHSKSAILQSEDIQGALDLPVSYVIPNHYQRALESSDSGVPMYEADRASAISQALLTLVGEMTGVRTERPGLLRRSLPSFLRKNP